MSGGPVPATAGAQQEERGSGGVPLPVSPVTGWMAAPFTEAGDAELRSGHREPWDGASSRERIRMGSERVICLRGQDRPRGQGEAVWARWPPCVETSHPALTFSPFIPGRPEAPSGPGCPSGPWETSVTISLQHVW